MIASITGRLTRKSTDYLVVDVSGLGYQVFVPLSTYYAVPDAGETISLHVHTHVREDALSLFGFLTLTEKEMFLLLMSVSGVGPKLALAVLSSLAADDLACAIQSSDDAKLCSIPGIGKKTAARIVLELKEKVKRLAPVETLHPAAASPGNDRDGDVVSALVNLGFKKQVAEEALAKLGRHQRDVRVEDLIREALGVLMKR